MKIVYRYIGNRAISTSHSGVITIASTLEKVKGELHIGYSFCSPQDKWDRSIARVLAVGRMMVDPIVISFDSGLEISHKLITELCEDNIWNHFEPNRIPTWVKKLLRNR